MNIPLLCRKALERWREDGVRGCYHAAAKYFARGVTDPFDLRFGTDTSGIIPLWRLKTSSPNAVFGRRYEATDREELERAVGLLGEDLSTFTFVDLGCGKGRPLIVASILGFGRVVGVEFSAELAETARKNVAKLGLAGVQVVQTDVTEFRFPASDLVVYLFNPFSREIMTKVVANLRESAAKRVYVIYNSPKCSDVLDSSGFLDRFGTPLATCWTMHIWRKASF
jgi:predicted RNA methylase